MELTCRRILVDSRFRTASSRSTSDFSVDLHEALTLPHGTMAYCTDILLPISFLTIQRERNAFLYLEYKSGDQVTRYRAVELTTSSYDGPSLAAHIKNMMNVTLMTDGEPFASNTAIPASAAPFSASFDKATGRMELIYANGTFRFWSTLENLNDADHGTRWTPSPSSAQIPPHTDSQNTTHDVVLPLSLYGMESGQSFAVDVRGIHQALILSPTLADRLMTITPTSTLPVLKRVPLVGNFGQLQSWDAHHQADRIEVGGLTLSRLHFSVTDILGAPLQLNSLPVSFSIIFEAP